MKPTLLSVLLLAGVAPSLAARPRPSTTQQQDQVATKDVVLAVTGMT